MVPTPYTLDSIRGEEEVCAAEMNELKQSFYSTLPPNRKTHRFNLIFIPLLHIYFSEWGVASTVRIAPILWTSSASLCISILAPSQERGTFAHIWNHWRTQSSSARHCARWHRTGLRGKSICDILSGVPWTSWMATMQLEVSRRSCCKKSRFLDRSLGLLW